MTNFLCPPSFTGLSSALILSGALMLASSAMHAQEWGLESRCGNRHGKHFGQGSFELAAGAGAIEWEGNHFAPLMNAAIFGRQRGPFKHGFRMGLTHLGRHHQGADDTFGSAESIRSRAFIPEIASVLRFDCFRGGFRPFAEGEMGTTLLVQDESTFDAEGHRLDHQLTSTEAGFHAGWSVGARFRTGRSTLLFFRYGKKVPLQTNPNGASSDDLYYGLPRQDLSFGISLNY